MKHTAKRFAALLAALVLALCLSIPAFAAAPLVRDEMGLFDADTYSQLEASAEAASDGHDCDVYFLVVDSIGDTDQRQYAKDYYLANGLGSGSEQSGILFLLAVGSRKYVTITYGGGVTAFTDYRIEQIEDAVVPYLSDDDWAEAASEYLSMCADTLDFYAEHGEPLDELVYSEVMFSDTVSGELPEHKRFIYETAIPYFEKRGIPTRVLRGQKTYLDCFYHIVSRGNAEGKLASFPLTGRCSIQRDCKLPPIRTYQKTLPQDTVYYLGIAADEPIRLARLKENQTSLLAKYNLTEKDAWAMCQAEGLLSPLYAFTGRGGCWFCPNASMRELRHLYNSHPDLWQLLLKLQDAPNKATERFNRSHTLHDLDLRFSLEGEQLSFFTYGER